MNLRQLQLSLPFSLLAYCLPAQVTPPVLAIDMLPEQVRIGVSGPQTEFVGAVVVSLAPDLRHYLVGLPPLLADFAVLGVGVADKQFVASVPVSSVPPGLFIYAQGIVLQAEVEATSVGSFVLDAQGKHGAGEA